MDTTQDIPLDSPDMTSPDKSRFARPVVRTVASLCVALLALAAIPAHADGDYLVTLAGQERGDMTVKTEGDERRIAFRFTDRGRGPETRTLLRTDAAGLPVVLEIDGNSYFKATVAE